MRSRSARLRRAARSSARWSAARRARSSAEPPALGGTFKAFGYGPFNASGDLTASYVVGVSLADALIVIGLVMLFLLSHGERPRDVIVGARPILPELAAGVPMIPVALGIAFG